MRLARSPPFCPEEAQFSFRRFVDAGIPLANDERGVSPESEPELGTAIPTPELRRWGSVESPVAK
jgi:hypothetical protein